MKFRNALLAATVMAAPVVFSHVASAQPVTGPYVSLGAGYNMESSQKAKNLITHGHVSGDTARIYTNNGYDVTGAVGYGFGNGFRAELEGDFMKNGFDKMRVGGTDFASGGHEGRYGAFANAYYDFNVGLPYLYPYLGAGIGWQESAFNDLNAGPFSFNKTRGALAYQGIAGLSFPISAVPGLSATLEYRFVALADSRKYNGAFEGMPSGMKVGSEYNNQINVGLRYQLFTPAPVPPAPAPVAAPVAAPAPAPAQTYLVFFDWNQYNLTSRALQVVSQAATASHSQNVTTLNVSGYTDTSGTPQYNQGLSMRRAQAVAAQLVVDGVAKSEIEIHAYGDTHLLVPTGPGVREPQNRRVEIVLQ
ncbi:MAG TPA: OmpA family protein [Acidocella sp.]|uniref:OmpA family protein n=1 Tax=Acidocella sp. TaxID=50710 RepID=UPI002C4B02F8|nr:OmpA family protein [Acidocella sp.]HVE23021.1 OmpA family protein [Acidocella sp.]